VKAILLCAGYATRLRPLTEDFPKPLLPVGGRPMLDWILDRVVEVTDDVHVVTNRRFAADFERWSAGRATVHDDGTTSNEDRLGAIGDVRFVLDRIGREDDVLVIAGDNLFDYSLADYAAWWRGKDVASAVAVHDVADLELVRQYSVVEMDADERIVAFVEKPAEPQSTLCATATYIYDREHLPLLEAYPGDPDKSGSLVEWLHERAPVYGYRFEGEWLDIGDRAQLLEADNRLRRRQGLPERAEYVLE
jgi:glucose-1-phosphate thymidylyltransferase